MRHCQIHPDHNSKNPQISPQEQKEIFQKPKSRRKLLIWNRQRAKSCDCHHHNHNGADQICLHSCRSHDQAAYNSHCISQCSRNPHSRFPDQLKGQFQKYQLRNTGKRHPFPGLGKRQNHIRRQNLCVKPDHRQIKPGKQGCRRQCHIPQCPEKGRHLKPIVPVLTAFHKTVKYARKNQRRRRVVTQQHHFSIQDFLGCPVQAAP